MTVIEREINRLYGRIARKRLVKAMNSTIEAMRRLSLICGSASAAFLNLGQQAQALGDKHDVEIARRRLREIEDDPSLLVTGDELKAQLDALESGET